MAGNFCCFQKFGVCSGEIIHLQQCSRDISAHLRYLKTGRSSQFEEPDLLLYRAGFFYVDEASRRLILICAGHRNTLGTYWKTGIVRCCHPLHQWKSKADWKLDFTMSKDIFYMYQSPLQVGSGKSQPCPYIPPKKTNKQKQP